MRTKKTKVRFFVQAMDRASDLTLRKRDGFKDAKTLSLHPEDENDLVLYQVALAKIEELFFIGLRDHDDPYFPEFLVWASITGRPPRRVMKSSEAIRSQNRLAHIWHRIEAQEIRALAEGHEERWLMTAPPPKAPAEGESKGQAGCPTSRALAKRRGQPKKPRRITEKIRAEYVEPSDLDKIREMADRARAEGKSYLSLATRKGKVVIAPGATEAVPSEPQNNPTDKKHRMITAVQSASKKWQYQIMVTDPRTKERIKEILERIGCGHLAIQLNIGRAGDPFIKAEVPALAISEIPKDKTGLELDVCRRKENGQDFVYWFKVTPGKRIPIKRPDLPIAPVVHLFPKEEPKEPDDLIV